MNECWIFFNSFFFHLLICHMFLLFSWLVYELYYVIWGVEPPW